MDICDCICLFLGEIGIILRAEGAKEGKHLSFQWFNYFISLRRLTSTNTPEDRYAYKRIAEMNIFLRLVLTMEIQDNLSGMPTYCI